MLRGSVNIFLYSFLILFHIEYIYTYILTKKVIYLCRYISKTQKEYNQLIDKNLFSYIKNNLI